MMLEIPRNKVFNNKFNREHIRNSGNIKHNHVNRDANNTEQRTVRTQGIKGTYYAPIHKI